MQTTIKPSAAVTLKENAPLRNAFDMLNDLFFSFDPNGATEIYQGINPKNGKPELFHFMFTHHLEEAAEGIVEDLYAALGPLPSYYTLELRGK